MNQCKFCLKFKYSLDESRLCVNCAKKAKIGSSRLVRFEQIDVNKVKPASAGSEVLMSRTEWINLKSMVDRYYSSVSDDEIAEYNAGMSKKQETKILSRYGRDGYIYLLHSSVGFYKIGRAINVDTRIRAHRRDYPIEIEPVFTLYVSDAIRSESFLLKTFKEKRMQGEWFDLSDQDVEWICSLKTNKWSRCRARKNTI